jgi:hypothetical protein
MAGLYSGHLYIFDGILQHPGTLTIFPKRLSLTALLRNLETRLRATYFLGDVHA